MEGKLPQVLSDENCTRLVGLSQEAIKRCYLDILVKQRTNIVSLAKAKSRARLLENVIMRSRTLLSIELTDLLLLSETCTEIRINEQLVQSFYHWLNALNNGKLAYSCETPR